MNYEKMMIEMDEFTEMIRDWQADNAPEYDNLEIREPIFVGDKWEAVANDDSQRYLLTDDGRGNIQINYLDTKQISVKLAD
jgi:hypothetical protein